MKRLLFSFSVCCLMVITGFAQNSQPKTPMNTALVLIDIQNDYFEKGAMPLAAPGQACDNARLILDRFRRDGALVIHVRHAAQNPAATFFLPNTPGAEINDKVKPRPEEIVIIKHYPNGFRETALNEELQTRNITSLVICGMMTHMCVDATTRAAKDFGYNCTHIGDACATRDLEVNGHKVNAKEVQNSFLAALNYYYATVKTTQQYVDNK